jgi:REP element-mobilizing transposase RayT
MDPRSAEPGLPLAYFITFGAYGTWVHGDERGSVDRGHNLPGTPYLAPDHFRFECEQSRTSEQPYLMDEARRIHVLEAVRQACGKRGWDLLAVHVRQAHVHVVVAAADTPEKVMHALKGYASRRLNEAGLDGRDRTRWARHGSTRYLWNRRAVDDAVTYVVDEQGAPMAVYDRRKEPPM